MSKEAYRGTVRLTVAQAIIRFLSNQYTERDGIERRLIAGAFGIFGHGERRRHRPGPTAKRDRAGRGREPDALHHAPQRAGAVHAAAAFAKTTNRLQTWMTTAVDRPRLPQHGDRRGDRDDQPPARPHLPLRPVRDPHPGPGPPAA